MKKSDTILEEIYEIRLKHYELTKNMTAEERTAYFNDRAAKAAQEFGFKIRESVEAAEREAAMA